MPDLEQTPKGSWIPVLTAVAVGVLGIAGLVGIGVVVVGGWSVFQRATAVRVTNDLGEVVFINRSA